jgi:hypothetical protein
MALAGTGVITMAAAADVGQRTSAASADSDAAPSLTEDPGFPLDPPAADTAAAEPPPVGPVTTDTPTPAAARPLKIVFLGDSVAKTTAAALVPMSGAYGITVDNRGILGCGVARTVPFRYFGKHYDAVPPGCETWPETWRAAVEADQPDVAVVLVGRWELMDRVIGSRWSAIGAPDFDSDVAASLDTAVAAAAATGGRVVLATTPYYQRGLRPDGGLWPEDVPARVDRFNELLRATAARHPGVAVVELGGRLSVDGRLAMKIDGVRVRTDGVHVAPEAGHLLAPWLLPQLRALAG